MEIWVTWSRYCGWNSGGKRGDDWENYKGFKGVDSKIGMN